MNRPGFEESMFFFGNEVEHTPAHGMETLFIIGLHNHDQIQELHKIASKASIRHVFFGANDSYWPKGSNEITAWENMILTFLDRGYWCSLDIPFSYVANFHEHNGLCERDRFIPIIKVPVPYTKLWNYNTCIKIDDEDFASTNPGVWVHQLHDLMKRSKFTDWSKYDSDEVIK